MLHEGRFPPLVHSLHADKRPHPFQKLLWKWLAHCLFIQSEYDILYLCIALDKPAHLCHLHKLLGRLGVFFLKQLLHDIGFDKPKFALRAHAVRRLDAGAVKIILNHHTAETVYRGYLRHRNEHQLPLQLLILRLFLECVLERPLEPLFHLCRRRPCKSHDKKFVNIDRVVSVQNPGQNPFHQHCRLAGARCRRHKNITISQINDLLLLLRPIHSLSS